MPRWLSEGISVYEERQENPSVGPGDEPRLSRDGARRRVPRRQQAQRRVPEAGQRRCTCSLRTTIRRWWWSTSSAATARGPWSGCSPIWAQSIPINEALARHTEPIEKLDKDFAAWFEAGRSAVSRGRLEAARAGGHGRSAAWAAWNKDHPNSFWGLLAEGQALVAERKWKQAIKPLEEAAKLYEGQGARESLSAAGGRSQGIGRNRGGARGVREAGRAGRRGWRRAPAAGRAGQRAEGMEGGDRAGHAGSGDQPA